MEKNTYSYQQACEILGIYKDQSSIFQECTRGKSVVSVELILDNSEPIIAFFSYLQQGRLKRGEVKFNKNTQADKKEKSLDTLIAK